MADTTTYTAKDIEVLEGLEPVRKRPAMYIGGTDARGYHHLLWEIVDNSVDEAINGHADRIEVTLSADHKEAWVSDNGRGIPVDVHPRFKKPAVELILCTLHAGGKFEGKNYQVAGGLHGVGSSVVNALSESMTATIRRDGVEWEQSYARGVPTGTLRRKGKARGHGTTIHFRPDPKIFGRSARFDPDRVKDALEAKSYLHRGLRIVFRDDASGDRVELHHPEGIVEFLGKTVRDRGKRTVHDAPFVYRRETGEEPRFEVALQWTEAPDESLRSYANGIPTAGGGSHETALKQALGKAIRGYLGKHKVAPKNLTLTAEDIREGVVAILSVYVAEPQFQGQTKDRLNNSEVTAPLEGALRTALEQWLLDQKSVAEAIVGRIVLAARAREASRAAVQEVKRKTAVSHRLNLPGKLADCASTDPRECELFLVEGDSAGGNAKQARDRRTQAILPLRGKVLNAERATPQAILQNRELQDIVQALGCGIGKSFDPAGLRYDRIFLLMDADSDGHHIATLLLTFFYRLLPGLIRGGHVYLAQPPLYRIDVGDETHWALDEDERVAVLAGLSAQARGKAELSRFKGLGEMTAKELQETTLDPRRRRALRVVIDEELATDRVLNELMGKDPAPRFQFIMEHAADAEAEALDV